MDHERNPPLAYESKVDPARKPPGPEFQTVSEAIVRTIAWIACTGWLVWGVNDDLNTRGGGPAICVLLCILIAEVVRVRAALRSLFGAGTARR